MCRPSESRVQPDPCDHHQSDKTHAHWSMSVCLYALVQATTSRPRDVPANILLDSDHVSILNQGLFSRPYIFSQAMNPLRPCARTSKHCQQDSLMAQALTSSLEQGTWYYGATHEVLWGKSCYFLPSNRKPENKRQTVGENNHWRDYSSFKVPASDFKGLIPGPGSCLRLPASRRSDFSCFRIIESSLR